MSFDNDASPLRTPMPSWMMSSEKLQEVIVASVELRAHIYAWREGMSRTE